MQIKNWTSQNFSKNSKIPEIFKRNSKLKTTFQKIQKYFQHSNKKIKKMKKCFKNANKKLEESKFFKKFKNTRNIQKNFKIQKLKTIFHKIRKNSKIFPTFQ